mmetsp:Transcript_46612/g.120694  ORF Transcript_46612/g.120694 Transcript_46612/m.120694 type:complete len:272 (+) Transcript_46612:8-823(+)
MCVVWPPPVRGSVVGGGKPAQQASEQASPAGQRAQRASSGRHKDQRAKRRQPAQPAPAGPGSRYWRQQRWRWQLRHDGHAHPLRSARRGAGQLELVAAYGAADLEGRVIELLGPSLHRDSLVHGGVRHGHELAGLQPEALGLQHLCAGRHPPRLLGETDGRRRGTPGLGVVLRRLLLRPQQRQVVRLGRFGDALRDLARAAESNRRLAGAGALGSSVGVPPHLVLDGLRRRCSGLLGDALSFHHQLLDVLRVLLRLHRVHARLREALPGLR